jgi:hypothetical protein
METAPVQSFRLREIESDLTARLSLLTGFPNSPGALALLLEKAAHFPLDEADEKGLALADETWADYEDAICDGPEATERLAWHRQTHDNLEAAGVRLVQARALLDAVLMSHEQVLDREAVHQAHEDASARYNYATEKYNASLLALSEDLADNQIIDDNTIVRSYAEALEEVNQAGEELLRRRNMLEMIREMEGAEISFKGALERYYSAAKDYRLARTAHEESVARVNELENLEKALGLLKRHVDPEDTGYY